MPKKNFIQTPIAAEQYDRCADCPLCGLIPEAKRREGMRKKYVCLGVTPHKALTSKGIWVKASKRDQKHPLHRPCDERFHAWVTKLKRLFPMRIEDYAEYRLPYEQTLQSRIEFD